MDESKLSKSDANRKPREFWMVIYPESSAIHVKSTEQDAIETRNFVSGSGSIVHVREVLVVPKYPIKRTVTEARISDVRYWINLGYTYEQIGRKYGITKQAIHDLIKRYPEAFK